MDIDKLKNMFIVSASENVTKSSKLLDYIDKNITKDSCREQIASLYILAHSIRSMSVFLPIYRITQLSKDMEGKIKLWQEESYRITAEDIALVRVEMDNLHKMIDHLEDYIDE